MIRCVARGNWLVTIEGHGNIGRPVSHVQKFAYRDITPDVALDRAFADWAEMNCARIDIEDETTHRAEIVRISIEPVKVIA